MYQNWDKKFDPLAVEARRAMIDVLDNVTENYGIVRLEITIRNNEPFEFALLADI